MTSLIGVGLRPTHFPHLEKRPQIQSNLFEAISENFMNTEGRPLEMLLKMRSHFPIALHGVSLSIGSDKGLNDNYLKKLKALINRVDPIIVSDHLCWAQAHSGNSHDLLPLPLNIESLNRVLANIDKVQSFLGRQILLENISYYLRFKESDIDEAQFINELCKKSGCKILLDLNNVYVNGINHGFDPLSFIDKIPNEHVGQIHLAGPSKEPGYLFDTHSTPVPQTVWSILKHVISKGMRVPIIVEWDQDIPEFNQLELEVIKTKEIIGKKGQTEHARQTT